MSAKKPSMSKASAALEVNTLPRMRKPTIARSATAKKYTAALPHLPIRACPSPGTNQPATAATSANAGLIGCFCVSAILFRQQRKNLRLHRSRNPRFPSVSINVYFAANSKIFQIDSRLDGKAGVRQNRARIVRFQAIHIGAIAVDFLADAVAGAMHEIPGVSRVGDDAARDGIHLPSFDLPAPPGRLLHEGNRAVAGGAHDLENRLILCRNLRAQITDPG